MAEYKLKTWLNKVVDWVWPRLTGKPEPSPDEQLMITATDETMLDEIENAVERRTSQVDERLRTVETKLVALLTLTSVLSAAVTAGFAAASTMQIQKGFPLIPVWFTLVLVFYIALNLLRSLWATVAGLMRRGYKQLTCEDIIPKDKEDKIRYKARLLNQRLNHVKWNDWVVNQKVSEMAVAHTALRNALVATGGVIFLALATAVLKLIIK
jgi:hypothetical protein